MQLCGRIVQTTTHASWKSRRGSHEKSLEDYMAGACRHGWVSNRGAITAKEIGRRDCRQGADRDSRSDGGGPGWRQASLLLGSDQRQSRHPEFLLHELSDDVSG